MKTSHRKIDIAKDLSNKTGFSVLLSKKLLDDFFECLLANINSNIYLKNLGSFKVLSKKQRIGRNPRTNKEYIISSRKVVQFKISEKFKKELNKI